MAAPQLAPALSTMAQSVLARSSRLASHALKQAGQQGVRLIDHFSRELVRQGRPRGGATGPWPRGQQRSGTCACAGRAAEAAPPSPRPPVAARSLLATQVDDIFACALKKQTGVSLKYM